ncbi:hypothetical protein FHG66_14670 [Rubellimicrobium rubrum]|uniref:Uncharacterized protein n=1 Tax=Rubellimicrobium rubrum TaxID=2585369 RepID=A0A5C4MSQ6_9RHOB|nr:hypothetical protein [Rubellimicrobium rubrum]TNC48358.1 hypothetical protein FHG66_14670 [Rubellimicrobium rubrum]
MLLGHLMVGVLGGLGAAAAALFAGQPGWMAVLAYLVLGNLAWVASLLLHMAWDSVRQAARQPVRAAIRAQPRGQIRLKPLNVGR